MSRIEDHVAKAWARRLSTPIVEKVRGELQDMAAELSGDSGLQNVWEEICAQVQNEESYHWAGYQDVIERLLYSHVEKLDRDARLALWADTERGWEYIDDYDEDWEDVSDIPVSIDVIVEGLKSEVLEFAASYESDSLDRYLSGADEFECGDEGEQGDDEENGGF